MRRALAVVFTLVALTATPALASEDAHVLGLRPATAGEVVDQGDEHVEDDGRDGTDPVAFATLLVAGMAAVAAMAALIFATKRAPA